MVAVYTSDIYDVSIRDAKAGKTRMGKYWMETLQAKCQLFGAIAHFHTGPLVSNERVVAERLARLQVAKCMISESLEYSVKVGSILHDLVKVYKL